MICANCGSTRIEWKTRPTEIGPGALVWETEPECQDCKAHGDDILPEE